MKFRKKLQGNIDKNTHLGTNKKVNYNINETLIEYEEHYSIILFYFLIYYCVIILLHSLEFKTISIVFYSISMILF